MPLPPRSLPSGGLRDSSDPKPCERRRPSGRALDAARRPSSRTVSARGDSSFPPQGLFVSFPFGKAASQAEHAGTDFPPGSVFSRLSLSKLLSDEAPETRPSSVRVFATATFRAPDCTVQSVSSKRLDAPTRDSGEQGAAANESLFRREAASLPREGRQPLCAFFGKAAIAEALLTSASSSPPLPAASLERGSFQGDGCERLARWKAPEDFREEPTWGARDEWLQAWARRQRERLLRSEEPTLKAIAEAESKWRKAKALTTEAEALRVYEEERLTELEAKVQETEAKIADTVERILETEPALCLAVSALKRRSPRSCEEALRQTSRPPSPRDDALREDVVVSDKSKREREARDSCLPSLKEASRECGSPSNPASWGRLSREPFLAPARFASAERRAAVQSRLVEVERLAVSVRQRQKQLESVQRQWFSKGEMDLLRAEREEALERRRLSAILAALTRRLRETLRRKGVSCPRGAATSELLEAAMQFVKPRSFPASHDSPSPSLWTEKNSREKEGPSAASNPLPKETDALLRQSSEPEEVREEPTSPRSGAKDSAH